MTAKLTITLSDEVLKALKTEKNITVALASGGGAAPASAAPAGATKATNGKAGPYRAGTLPAKLLSWAGGRKRPFGVPDLMKRFGIKRGHTPRCCWPTSGRAAR
jgi:hypothetical protein